MRIIDKPISDIVLYDKNPRKNDQAVDAVAASIREFGFKVPVIVDADNVVVAGHTRIKAARQLGITEVPVIVADDLTPEQIKAFRLADNKVSEIATWDIDLLNAELAELSLMDFDMTGFGLDAPSIAGEASEDDFEPELPEEPITQPGDVWRLGRHRLACGDSTNADDVAWLMAGTKADMYLTDPPYGVDYTGKTKDRLKIINDELSGDHFREFLTRAFMVANNVMKHGAVFYIWHADSHGYDFRAACMAMGWEVRQCLIWSKNMMVMGRQDYHWKHEPCLYGWKDGAAHLWAADRRQTTILEFDRPTQSASHPTMKPVRLFDYLIQNNTKGEDIVFDGFAGSGTTIIACEQNGRVGYCMELDPKYCDVIIKRWEKLTGGLGERIGS